MAEDSIIITRATAPTPPPKPTPKAPSLLPRIRTYAADMSDAIRERGESLASIVNTEKVTAPEEHHGLSRKVLVMAIAAGVLIILGIAAIITAIVVTGRESTAPPAPTSIIFPNKTRALEVPTGVSLSQALASTRGDSLSLGEIERITVTRDGVALSPQDLLTALDAPPALTRQVTGAMVGIHSFDRNQPFIILEVAAYDFSFNALLDWESEMGRGLGAFFAPVNSKGAPPTLTFTDAILQNLDVRRSQSVWPVIYTFPEKNLIVITTNEFTLKEVIARLGSAHR